LPPRAFCPTCYTPPSLSGSASPCGQGSVGCVQDIPSGPGSHVALLHIADTAHVSVVGVLYLQLADLCGQQMFQRLEGVFNVAPPAPGADQSLGCHGRRAAEQRVALFPRGVHDDHRDRFVGGAGRRESDIAYARQVERLPPGPIRSGGRRTRSCPQPSGCRDVCLLHVPSAPSPHTSYRPPRPVFYLGSSTFMPSGSSPASEDASEEKPKTQSSLSTSQGTPACSSWVAKGLP
jgi:hypothetical protein